MKRRIALQLAFCGLVVGSQAMMAASATSLADWCVNLNSDINTACNGGGGGGASPGGGSISLASFDTTLEPATNNLGSVVVNLAAGINNQYANFYADYDLDYAATGSFNDFGTVNGALPASVSYEMDDPNTSNIFSDFAGNTLSDANNVGTGSGPPNQCCDVAFALGVGGLDVAAGGSGTVTFTVSDTAPASGFYLQQTNNSAGDSIYLSEVTSITAPVGTGTPEPSTFGLGLMACVAAILYYARSRKRAQV